MADLRQAINWAAEEDMVWFTGKGKPSFKFPVDTDESANPEWLTKKDVRKVKSNAAFHCKVFIEIAVQTAARNGAILDLKWDQVNFKTGYINFGNAVGKKKRPKQKMSPELIKVLKKAKNLRCTDYVIEHNGEAVKSIDTAFENAVVRAGFGDPQPQCSPSNPPAIG